MTGCACRRRLIVQIENPCYAVQKSSREQALKLPDRSGVYLMKNEDGTIIYVGKARNLKKRVVSYFNGAKDRKTSVLVGQIDQIDFITTRNEFEALILENTLIKQWKPRYNINLKDGKSYPVIRITNEDFPRVFRTRRIIDDGSEYFGPYPSVSTLDVYLELIEKLHPLRKCRGPLKKREHPCLYYHINRCSAPCAGLATKDEYRENVDSIRRMLTGSIDDLTSELKTQMNRDAELLQFEHAAEVRDAITALERVSHQQEVVDFDSENRDYIGMVEREFSCCFVVFQMRTGRLIGRDVYYGENYTDINDALEQFILQYYAEKQILPTKLFVPETADVDLIQKYFTKRRGGQRGAQRGGEPTNGDEALPTEVRTPESERDISIGRLARDNALEDLLRHQQSDRVVAGLEELKLALSLPIVPTRIEGFDISHIGGKHTVASLVSFLDGKPDKTNYRKFHVKTLDGRIDDFAAMREVVARRYTRIVNESLKRPDLVLVDGGRGQVSAARSVLDALGLASVPLAGLAKREEEIFLPGIVEPIRLPEGSGALRILQQVRDESHRFATTFNKSLRKKDVKLSILEEVQGIGPKRAARLIKEFKSLDNIVAAKIDAIAETANISESAAEAVVLHIRNVTV